MENRQTPPNQKKTITKIFSKISKKKFFLPSKGRTLKWPEMRPDIHKIFENGLLSHMILF